MRKCLLIFLFFHLASAPVYSAVQPKLLVLPFTVVEKKMLTGEQKFAANAFQWLNDDLSLTGVFNLLPQHPEPAKSGGKTSDRDAAAGKAEGADLVLSGYIDWFDDKLIVDIRMTDVSNKRLLFEDQVYTFNLSNAAVLRSAVSNLAWRIVKKYNREDIGPYAEGIPGEETDETNEGISEGETNAQPVEKTTILRQLSLLDLGYQFPTGFEFTFIEGSYNWLHPDWRVGIGIGSYLVKMCPNFPGYTNATGTMLPIQLSVPIWTNPDKNKITDLIFRAEWAWYAPINISGSTTNTNAGFFLDSPVNYLDLRLSFYFAPFAGVSAGCMWTYNTGNVYFYIGGSVFLGFYQKE